jgi:hypothetical protein
VPSARSPPMHFAATRMNATVPGLLRIGQIGCLFLRSPWQPAANQQWRSSHPIFRIMLARLEHSSYTFLRPGQCLSLSIRRSTTHRRRGMNTGFCSAAQLQQTLGLSRALCHRAPTLQCSGSLPPAARPRREASCAYIAHCSARLARGAAPLVGSLDFRSTHAEDFSSEGSKWSLFRILRVGPGEFAYLCQRPTGLWGRLTRPSIRSRRTSR